MDKVGVNGAGIRSADLGKYVCVCVQVQQELEYVTTTSTIHTSSLGIAFWLYTDIHTLPHIAVCEDSDFVKTKTKVQRGTSVWIYVSFNVDTKFVCPLSDSHFLQVCDDSTSRFYFIPYYNKSAGMRNTNCELRIANANVW